MFQKGKFGTKTAIEISQMTQKIATLAALAFLVLGCSRAGSKVQRNQQQYQTVQEGSASGVTSTINAPGETTPPLTNTNVDTTTNFTLPTNPAPLGTDTAAGSMASAMPGVAPSNPAGTPGMPASRPRTSTRPAPVANAPVVTDTIGSTTPPMPTQHTAPAPREQRPQTDTAATDTVAPPPPTDTMMTDTSSSTTSTSSSTDTKKKKDDGKKKDSNNDQSDQPPPPPPPTATDTRG